MNKHDILLYVRLNLQEAADLTQGQRWILHGQGALG